MKIGKKSEKQRTLTCLKCSKKVKVNKYKLNDDSYYHCSTCRQSNKVKLN